MAKSAHDGVSPHDRCPILAANFLQCLETKNFPKAYSRTTLSDASMSPDLARAIFKTQLYSRHLDFAARQLKTKDLGYYTIGSSGHEGMAAVAAAARVTDLAFLHYRDTAFYLERCRHLKHHDPVQAVLYSLTCAVCDPIASGRHKVLGSYEAYLPPQTSTIASHLPKAVGAAFSIARAKELDITRVLPDDSVVLCCFGDASVNHASAQAAFNAAQWIAAHQARLPLVFVCEDNGMGISVPTPQDWIESTVAARPYLHYLQADGLNFFDVTLQASQALQLARYTQQPVFLHLKCVRLLGHAGSDIELQYQSLSQIEAAEADDPLCHSARLLYDNNVMSLTEMRKLDKAVAKEIKAKAKIAADSPPLSDRQAVMSSISPANNEKERLKAPTQAARKKVFGKAYAQLKQKRTMAQLINLTLTDLMISQKNIVVFGEDVAQKGGVYHVTANLMQRFGQRRVFDTLLDETTILGTAIGMAHNGFLPIPEIQFLAYLHNAEDQLRGEAATLSFFSNAQFHNPMVVRVPGLAYQKGFGGHFHNDNSLAVLRDIPGLLIACPSHGEAAVKLLRACVQYANQGGIAVFLEPIALYMTKDLYAPGDQLYLGQYPKWTETLALGEVTTYGSDAPLAIVTYGNGTYLSRQAAKQLQEAHKLPVKIIDLNWLAPLPINSLMKALEKVEQVLIVDEGRASGSVSEGLITGLVEAGATCTIKRLTGADSFIPLGPAMATVLPTVSEIVNSCLTLTKKGK